MFHRNSHRRKLERDFRELGSELSSAAREKLNQFREGASEYYQLGRKKTGEWAEDLESFMREQPLKAALMAAGLGLVIGLLFKQLVLGSRGRRAGYGMAEGD